ncbi:protein LSM14 homolog A isoform X3 [Schistocerca gregaria]|uniref:protein LSM14 homolog A isoform X3 n=1 Tax=Schistocerca gregaria TaxID=7010 RepID=UPI00211E1E56|nr:protein LSM14 homolog A isoform X3 [Schistocerca gregaria]
MSTGMPELGSKISLISKADIRYEGRLFTLDPQECTIALANVRSFGTEDRETQYRVAPQNEVYDYILFRGSDIKDIRVVNNVGPLPNDPAIVQLSVPSSLSSAAYQTQGFSHPVLGPMGPSLPQYPSSYSAMSTMTGLPGAVVPNIGLHPDHRTITKPQSELVMPVQIQDREPASNKDQDLLTGGSRPTTPLLLTRKSPTMDQGVQVNQLGLTPIKKDTKEQQNRDGTIQNSRLQIGIERPMRTLPNQHYSQQYTQQYSQQRDREVGQERSRDTVQRNQQNAVTQQAPQQMQPLPQRLPQQRGGWGNRTGARRSRARGGGSGNVGGGMGRQQVGTPTAKGKTLKFDSEYDFEQANTEFEELRSQLAKTKIGDGKANGDAEKKDDSGNETGIGEGETEEEHEVYYDRSKSFFDNISCEAVERSKGRSQRTDWRTERKLNSETFGVASARRGGFRGRGYYNRGGYRGQYRNNFRGQGSGILGANRNRNSSTNMQQTPAPIANSTPPRAVTVQSN